jgi:hypothetical protein
VADYDRAVWAVSGDFCIHVVVVVLVAVGQVVDNVLARGIRRGLCDGICARETFIVGKTCSSMEMAGLDVECECVRLRLCWKLSDS